MNLGRASWWSNPTAWYVSAGIGLLAFSLWLPWLSASRTTRTEGRADELAEALLDATFGFPAPLTEADLASIEARFLMLASSRGIRVKDVERVDPPPTDALLCFTNKHYAFQLCESPPDANQSFGAATTAALEVTAWPQHAVGPGHCAFFYPDNAERAFTRNLRAGYAGFRDGEHPLPGGAHRRPGLANRRQTQYPGNDNENWMPF